MGMLGAAFGIGFCLGPFLGGMLGHYDKAWPAYVAAALCADRGGAHVPQAARVAHAQAETEAEAWLHPSRFAPILRKPVLVQLLVISFFIDGRVRDDGEHDRACSSNDTFGFERAAGRAVLRVRRLVIIIVQGGLIGRLTKRFGEWPLAVAGPLLVARRACSAFIATAWWPLLALLLRRRRDATRRAAASSSRRCRR